MSDEIYKKLAKVLDTLPNGFPETENNVEINLLKWVFTPEEAELFCDLRLTFETAEQIAERTGRPIEGLEDLLNNMLEKGQLMGAPLGGVMIFKMIPWVLGIYEFQAHRMTKEFAEMNEEFMPIFQKQFFSKTPQLMQTIPIEKDIPVNQEALPFEKVSTIIENGLSWAVGECVCKKEQTFLGNPCDRPLEVCMAIAPVPGAFETPRGNWKNVTKEYAYTKLKEAEEAALVHLTGNYQAGHFYICNCCKCCCGVLDGINKLGIPAKTVINSHYYAVIDQDLCTACGICAEERCQVNAIFNDYEDSYKIIKDDCIGCGLCISTCPEEAISLLRKTEKDIVSPPDDEMDWFKKRGKVRNIDFSKYE